jgi:tRNA-guanine family transglycosylase
VNQQELLGLALLSEHNVRFLLDLTAGARAAIERGELTAFKAQALERLGPPPPLAVAPE